MTIEEKAKAYDEALERARNYWESPRTCFNKDMLIEIFPVLAKNEDEMIRKELINWINGKTTYEWSYEWCENKDRWIAYLEKLKEANKAIEAVERIDKYIDENVANAHDMKDSNPDKKYYRGWDDALGEMARILQDVYSGEKQKEQKPAEWNPNNEDVTLFNKAVTTNPNLTPSERAKLDIIRMKFKRCNGNTANLAEWSEEDEENFKWFDKFFRVESVIAGGRDIPQDKYLWFKSLRPQPKQEWNEEDEKIYQTVFNHFNSYEKYSCSTGVKKEHVLSWLKSLKPSWKPSEEQMEALDEYIYAKDPNTEKYSKAVLSLRDELKKLM